MECKSIETCVTIHTLVIIGNSMKKPVSINASSANEAALSLMGLSNDLFPKSPCFCNLTISIDVWRDYVSGWIY